MSAGAGESGVRGGKRRRGLVGAGELDLLPLMGVFLVLLPLLLVGAVFEQITIIDMNLPADAAAATPVVAAAHDATKDADLTLRIAGDQYELTAKNLPPRVLPRTGAGAEAALTAALGEVKRAWPAAEEVVIVSEPTTRYDELVKVMDLARGAGWPQAALTGDSGRKG